MVFCERVNCNQYFIYCVYRCENSKARRRVARCVPEPTGPVGSVVTESNSVYPCHSNSEPLSPLSIVLIEVILKVYIHLKDVNAVKIEIYVVAQTPCDLSGQPLSYLSETSDSVREAMETFMILLNNRSIAVIRYNKLQLACRHADSRPDSNIAALTALLACWRCLAMTDGVVTLPYPTSVSYRSQGY
ncbi:hypothetical protein J6590_060684 [Homalodisca vitripennis]|nr:hypothetical protein J6590_060684 [Homalodisca vitripennis]